MDHVDNILSSDLLERYVLGDVSLEEQEKVELLCLDHRAIRERLAQLEKTMEKTAIANAVTPPSGTRECIMKNISGQNIAQPSNLASPQITSPQWWKYVAAASIAILGTWMIMRSQVISLTSEIDEQSAEIAQLRQDCDQLNEMYAYINHGGTMPYILDGTAFDKESQVIVYWNDQLKKSMLRVIELPGIRAEETYQLWADVDGKMLSLGTFDAALAINDAIPMDFLDKATSLNITIEPKGGSKHPTVSTLTANVLI